MKRKQTIIGIGILVLFAITAATPLLAQRNSPSGSIEAVLQDIEPGTLSSAEEAGILLMREEEKLARDVYLTLYEKWNIPVFANIAESEETHMDSMELLIERYGLADPVPNESSAYRGTYANEGFEELYAELTERGLSSYAAALEVGALIEDLDIADLQELIGGSVNDDVRVVYQNLLKGSRNHMRSFARQLQRYGQEYTPEHISISDYRSIIGSRNEAGVISDPHFSF